MKEYFRGGPIGDGVESPTAQALVNGGGIGRLPVRAVFALEIGTGEGEAIVPAPCVVALENEAAAEELLELRQGARKVLEPVGALVNRGVIDHPHTVNAMREEQAAVRVNQPPLAVGFLRAEKSAGLKLRSVGPAAILVPILRAGLRGEFLGLALPPLLEFR